MIFSKHFRYICSIEHTQERHRSSDELVISIYFSGFTVPCNGLDVKPRMREYVIKVRDHISFRPRLFEQTEVYFEMSL